MYLKQKQLLYFKSIYNRKLNLKICPECKVLDELESVSRTPIAPVLREVFIAQK